MIFGLMEYIKTQGSERFDLFRELKGFLIKDLIDMKSMRFRSLYRKNGKAEQILRMITIF